MLYFLKNGCVNLALTEICLNCNKNIMNKFTLLIFLIYSQITLSQCPNGSSYFSTQKDIDDFKINYPNCKNFNNDISITGNTDNDKITNLDSFSNLETINNLDFFSLTTDLNINGLSNLKTVESISFNQNGNGFKLTGSFLNLQIIENSFSLSNNYTSSIDLSNKFPSLTSVKGSFVVSNNNSLIDITLPNNILEINQGLFIKSNDELKSINGFDELANLKNSIEIIANFNLNIIPDFNKLERIEGNLIFERHNIEKIIGFNNLIYLEGEFKLQNNYFLSEISGFNSLPNLSKNFMINGASNLNNLTGFTNLKSIEGDFHIGSIATANFESFNRLESTESFTISAIRDETNNFTGFINLKSVGGYGLLISDIQAKEMATFNNLQTSNGLIIVNTKLEVIDSFKNLTEVDGDLSLYSNTNALEFNSFESLTLIKQSLNIHLNDGLKSINGFNNLTNIEGRIYIQDNPYLNEINGLQSLKSVNKDVHIYRNNELVEINGFNKIDRIDDGIVITFNDKLEKITAFTNLQNLNGFLSITYNPILNNAIGFKSLEIINDGLEIRRSRLKDLNDFSNLKTFNGNTFSIQDNEEMESLNGLNNLISKVQNLNIRYNNSLTDISALKNIESITDYLIIRDNELLSTCANKLICDHISKNGLNIIDDNKSGCNNISEISLECSTLNNETIAQPQLLFYPNPTKDKVFLKGIDINLGYNLIIYNILGQVLLKKQLNNLTNGIDISNFKEGIYYFEVKNSNQKSILKVSKY